jgi:hypothetical protein
MRQLEYLVFDLKMRCKIEIFQSVPRKTNDKSGKRGVLIFSTAR